ncbi:hypothetical protein ECTT12B_4596, partial [Escherichia coli TT12B]
MAKVPI